MCRLDGYVDGHGVGYYTKILLPIRWPDTAFYYRSTRVALPKRA
jgi:hypothetical protein